MLIETKRLLLRPFSEVHRAAFAAMNSDPAVMADLGGPFTAERSNAKFERYVATFENSGSGRFAIESLKGQFLGYAGLMPILGDHPLGAHVEIGWRLIREAWGQGYATEAASAALCDGFDRVRLPKIFSYTAPDNLRSQAVMERLKLKRDEGLDFVADYDGHQWHGLVWVALPNRNGS